MPIQVTRWACSNERCKKNYSRENDAKRHETVCAFSPDNRACPTCEHDGLIAVKQADGVIRGEPHCAANANRDGRPWIMNCIYWEKRREE